MILRTQHTVQSIDVILLIINVLIYLLGVLVGLKLNAIKKTVYSLMIHVWNSLDVARYLWKILIVNFLPLFNVHLKQVVDGTIISAIRSVHVQI